jgi:hypothetical protein
MRRKIRHSVGKPDKPPSLPGPIRVERGDISRLCRVGERDSEFAPKGMNPENASRVSPRTMATDRTIYR